MKKIIVFILLFVSVNASAQNIAVTDTVIRFGVTEKGKPDGEKAENEISKDGGSLQSSDGKVELIFPAGAVTKKTAISIQPVTNHAPNGSGKAYQMEPSGINFQQPVQIIFHYTDEETEGSLPDLMGIAMQDDKGLWSPLDKVALDTSLKTIKADINHFSSYINYARARIKPSSAKVKVNGSLRLKIIYTVDPYDDLSPIPLHGTTEVEVNPNEVWSVNGIPNGNSTIGLISVSQNKSAIFKAPAQVPDQNPVAVSVQAVFKSSTRYNNKTLVSNILIYGNAYEVKMVTSTKGGTIKSWGGIKTSKDEGSFIVSLDRNKPAVINIKNNFEVITDNCTKTILNPTTCTGPIHVAGIKQIKLTAANPPGQPYPIVEIWFMQYPVELTRFNYTNCPPPPGFKGGPAKAKIDFTNWRVAMALLPMLNRPALPHYLKFEAKEGEYVFPDYNYGSEGGNLYLKFSVKQIKDD